jgi:hypothetical protein
MATILPFVRPADCFGPEVLAAMSAAFDATIASLRKEDQRDVVCEIIAKRIVAAALSGERDPERLRQQGLSALNYIAE